MRSQAPTPALNSVMDLAPTQVGCGVLVYVMGPSGAGKDSLIARAAAMEARAWQARPLHVARRRITRPADATENHISMTHAEFAACLGCGEFVMHWESHGLHYGIGGEILDRLAEGSVVIINGSRAYFPEAKRRFPGLIPVTVRVDPNVLRQRLLARNRETPEEIEARLCRAAQFSAEDGDAVIIDNSGDLNAAAAAFCLFIGGLRVGAYTFSPSPRAA